VNIIKALPGKVWQKKWTSNKQQGW